MVRMEDTPYDVAMQLSKQELARRLVEANSMIVDLVRKVDELNEILDEHERAAKGS